MPQKILLIDDDNEFLESVQNILETNGYNIVSAGTASEGYDKAVETKPDLIISDVMMAYDSDGLDGVLKMSKDEKTSGIPIIIMTGIRKPDFLLKSYAPEESCSSVKAIIEKPLNPELLLDTVKKILS